MTLMPIFFTAKKVLLDNLHFKNIDLLSNVDIVTPFYIGGINRGSRKLRIREDGDFNDIGRVGLATRAAAANTLLKMRLKLMLVML